MTTIAYRDGVLAGDSYETMVADALQNESAITITHNCRKVFRLPNGELFGASRGSEDIERLYRALMKGLPPPKLEDINAIRIDRKGRVWYYEGNIWQHVKARYYAVGSGSVFALAAMDAGATAIEAVRIGIKRDPYSGGRVTHVRLRK
jgi:hypothetical protein